MSKPVAPMKRQHRKRPRKETTTSDYYDNDELQYRNKYRKPKKNKKYQARTSSAKHAFVNIACSRHYSRHYSQSVQSVHNQHNAY